MCIRDSYLMWAVQSTVVEKLLEKGLKPSVYISNHMPDEMCIRDSRCCASPALRTVWMARPLSMWIPFTAGINISLTSLWKSKMCIRDRFCGVLL